jgi:HIV Tat-specific factor 1
METPSLVKFATGLLVRSSMLTLVTVYFRPESVNLAINMLDDSDFRLGVSGVKGKMRVKVADQNYKVQKDRPAASQEAKKKGTSANRDREKAIKKAEEMNKYVARKMSSHDPTRTC